MTWSLSLRAKESITNRFYSPCQLSATGGGFLEQSEAICWFRRKVSFTGSFIKVPGRWGMVKIPPSPPPAYPGYLLNTQRGVKGFRMLFCDPHQHKHGVSMVREVVGEVPWELVAPWALAFPFRGLYARDTRGQALAMCSPVCTWN